MKNNPLKRIIFFDIDDTLFNSSFFSMDARYHAFRTVIDKGFPEQDLEKLYQIFEKVRREKGSNYDKHFNEIFSNYISNQRMLDRFVALAVTSYNLYKSSQIEIYKCKGIEKILRNLSRKNFSLGIISTGIGVKQWDKLFRLELDKYFNPENVYISESFNVSEKRELFKFIYDKYTQLKFDQIWLVEDKESDVIEAKKNGFKTIKVQTGRHNIKNGTESCADIVIPNAAKIPIKMLKNE